MVQGKIDEMRVKLEGDVKSTLGELSDLKAKLAEKESMISRLNSLITQQERQISQLKVKMDKETFDTNLFLKVMIWPVLSRLLTEIG